MQNRLNTYEEVVKAAKVFIPADMDSLYTRELRIENPETVKSTDKSCPSFVFI